jgi:nitrate reductase gamma subunit
VLPYFAGTGLVVARRYDDQVVTSPVINNVFMCMTILAAFLMGLISALFVPRLPLDVPRRGFDLYSWLSAFHAHELVPEHPTGISKDMELRDIKDYTSKLRFRHVG